MTAAPVDTGTDALSDTITGVVLAAVGLSGGIDWIIGHATAAGVGP